MSASSDPKRQVGAKIHALAIHVTSRAECGRRYGVLKKTKLVPGVVVSVEIDRSGKPANCFILADFDLGGGITKRKLLNVRSVRAGRPTGSVPTTLNTSEEVENLSRPHQSENDNHPQQVYNTTYSSIARTNEHETTPVTTSYSVHATIWQTTVDGEDEQPVGGPIPRRSFGIRTITGETICADCDYSHRTPIDYFLMLFPPRQLREMVRLTNHQSATRETRSSKDICRGTAQIHGHFNTLHKPVQRGELSSEQYRWRLVDDFVMRFNEHRESHVVPSEFLCVDESIYRWYGQGGDWINHGIPMYVAIDRKPENGCEIQNTACGLSGIMIRMRIVRTAEEECAHLREEKNGLIHGTIVLKELIAPWAHTGRVVCADSYFASVTAARELKKMNLRFIGVIKTATTHFPMAELGYIETTYRGESHCLVEKIDGKIELMAVRWVDRDRRYFVSSASSRASGTPYTRKRWRQLDDRPNADPERVELTIPQPQVGEIYYSTCAMIDRQNRCRQSDLALEKRFGTLDWSMRVNMSILGMCIVDSWLAYKTCKGERCFMTQQQFYIELLTEIIDNKFEFIGNRDSQNIARQSVIMVNGAPRSGIDSIMPGNVHI